PGVFLGLGVDYGALGALAGGIAAQILGGADPGDIAIVGMDEFAITLNGATANGIGLSPPEDMALTTVGPVE
ncbi:MAG: hypothetical protein AAGD34_01495, partial [Pseudomonadota bacterium]